MMRYLVVAVALGFMIGIGGACSPAKQEAPSPQKAAQPAPEKAAQPAPAKPAPAPAAEKPAETPAPAPETAAEPAKAESKTVTVKPGPDAQTELQEALITAEPGSTIQLEAGTYEFQLGLSLDVDNVTVRGAGMDKTILDFKKQEAGAEGLYVTSDNVTLEDFAIVDTKGNGMKSQEANNITIRRVRAEWTGGPKTENGAYGIYPVSSKNVHIDGCVAIGGSDSGIYVGQSTNVIVENSRAEYNVAGIEIENCHDAEVRNCTATNNAGGLLVFDLPDLPQQRGHNIRLYNNKSFANNTPNFAPKGNIVAKVPTGTGVMIMANSNVEVFDNDIHDNDTTNMMVVSYQSTMNEIKDPNYYPYAEAINIHNNTFGPCGTKPGNDGGQLMASILGTPMPDIVWDGIVNEKKLVDGKLPADLRLYIHDNKQEGGGEVTFANLGGLATLKDPSKAKVTRDLAAHAGTLPPVKPVEIPGTK